MDEYRCEVVCAYCICVYSMRWCSLLIFYKYSWILHNLYSIYYVNICTYYYSILVSVWLSKGEEDEGGEENSWR